MAKSKFEARLDAVLKQVDEPTPPLYAQMKQRLDEVVAGLQDTLDASKQKATVALEPGHMLNAGQQFNVVVRIANRNQFRDTLFRAYLPPSGAPATLDFIGDRPEKAQTPEELEDRVIEFLSLEPIQGMMRSLKEVVRNTT
ncbi:MAG TPA: hypothetical protein VF624_01420 [Tepidisphaeraceae bacterium]|jgi:hypothetical protein